MLKGLKSKYSAFHVPPSANAAGLHYDLVAVVDPASRDAQRFSQMLFVLQQSLPCNITVYLNPVSDLSDLPLKKYALCLCFSPGVELECMTPT